MTVPTSLSVSCTKDHESSPISWRRKSLPFHASFRRASIAVLGALVEICALRPILVVDQDVTRCKGAMLRTWSMTEERIPSNPSAATSVVS